MINAADDAVNVAFSEVLAKLVAHAYNKPPKTHKNVKNAKIPQFYNQTNEQHTKNP